MSNSAKLTAANKKSIRLAEGSKDETKMTPTPSNGSKTYPLQKVLFDLDTFSEVKLGKNYTFVDVSSVQDALAKLGNDSEKLIQVINDGLRAEVARQERANPAGWYKFNEEDELTDQPFSGTLADDKKVNNLVLTLAKTVFGFNKDMTAEQKNASRDQARAMIQNTPAIKEGLKKSAALTVDAEAA